MDHTPYLMMGLKGILRDATDKITEAIEQIECQFVEDREEVEDDEFRRRLGGSPDLEKFYKELLTLKKEVARKVARLWTPEREARLQKEQALWDQAVDQADANSW